MAGKFALLIGNSQYRDRDLGGLRAPDVDVRAFEEVLRSPDICEFTDVRCLLNEGFAHVHREIARFYGGRGRDDLLLLYFSGHGIKDDAGHLYLAVHDTERAVLSGTAVPSSFIAGQMDACNSRSLVLMLDCCNSGAFAAGTKGAGQMVDTRAAFQGNGIGRVVLTATDSTQYAWEGNRVIGDEADKSLFTHFIVEGLRTGAADIDDDGYINVDELYDYVFDQIRQRTHKQTPSKCVYQAHGELLLAKNCSPGAAALPDLLAEDIGSRHAEVRFAAVPEVEKHLTHARRGAAAEEALERLMREDDSRKVVQAATAALDRHHARILRERGELDQARDRVERALLIEAGHRGARTLKAEIERAIASRDVEAVRAAANEINSSLPHDVDRAAAALARADAELKQPPELAALREQVHALQEQRHAAGVAAETHLSAARAAISRGAFGQALRSLDEAGILKPGAAELDALTRVAREGAAAAERAERLRQADKLVEKADVLQQTDLEAALAVVESALRDNPEHPRGLALRETLMVALAEDAARRRKIAFAEAQVRAHLLNGEVDAASEALAEAENALQHPGEFAEVRAQLDAELKKRSDAEARAAAKAAAEAALRAKAEQEAGELQSLQDELDRRRTARADRERAVAALVSELSWAVRLRRFNRARRLSIRLLALDPANAHAAELQIDIERLAAQHAKTLDAIRRVGTSRPAWAAAVIVLVAMPLVLFQTSTEHAPGEIAPGAIDRPADRPAITLQPPVAPAVEPVPSPPPTPSVSPAVVTPAPRHVTPQPVPSPAANPTPRVDIGRPVTRPAAVPAAPLPAPTPEVRPNRPSPSPELPRSAATDRPPVVDESPAPAPAPQPPPREPAPAPAARPVPAPAVTPARNERADIENVVRRYQDAFGRLDAAALQALWPSMPAAQANQLRQNFAGARDYDLQLSNGNISISGETATASYSGRIAFTPKVGRASAADVDIRFRLRKAGDAWTIEAVDTKRR